jgi:hypothetical protein
MKRNILVGFVLAVLVVSSRAADTNQTAVVSTNKPASESSNTLTILAAVGNAGNPPQTGTVATNRPACESSVSMGFSLTKGNSDTLLTIAAFKTRTNTPANEFLFGLDGAYGVSDSVKNNETLHGVSQYNHLFSEHFYGYLNVEGLHDGMADLQM